MEQHDPWVNRLVAAFAALVLVFVVSCRAPDAGGTVDYYKDRIVAVPVSDTVVCYIYTGTNTLSCVKTR